MRLVHKIYRKWIKLRLQPIRIFCLHHVCNQFNAECMYPCDWIGLSFFQSKINDLRKQGYEFISLSEAYEHLQKDWIRTKKYAVLTFDDGYKSLFEVLPWLEEQRLPATLFINAKYLDGKSYRENPKEQYLTYNELFNLISPLLEIGHHGWEHTYIPDMTTEEIEQSIKQNNEILTSHPNYIPFWAYTCGRYNAISNSLLEKYGIIPVKVGGGKNYSWNGSLDRELLVK